MLIINKDRIIDRLKTGDFDKEQIFDICTRCYTMYPTSKRNYIRDCITMLYNKLSFSNADHNTASAEINNYCKEEVLLTILRYNHNVITNALNKQIKSLVNNVIFDRMNEDYDALYIELPDVSVWDGTSV